MTTAAPRTADVSPLWRTSAILMWVVAAGFGLPTVTVAVYLLRNGQLPWFLDQFPMYGGPVDAWVGPTGYAVLILLFGGVALVEAAIGLLLWRARPAGALLSLALLPVEIAFWAAFALPIPPVVAAAPRWSTITLDPTGTEPPATARKLVAAATRLGDQRGVGKAGLFGRGDEDPAARLRPRGRAGQRDCGGWAAGHPARLGRDPGQQGGDQVDDREAFAVPRRTVCSSIRRFGFGSYRSGANRAACCGVAPDEEAGGSDRGTPPTAASASRRRAATGPRRPDVRSARRCWTCRSRFRADSPERPQSRFCQYPSPLASPSANALRAAGAIMGV